MLELVMAGGWLMLPIVLCSVAALGIVFERLYTLREVRVAPEQTAEQALDWARSGAVDAEKLIQLQGDSPLGRVLAAGLANRGHPREFVKDAIEEVGRVEAHGLSRYLNALGTIAAITPLLGLLGTVVGMISVFTTITTSGVGNPTTLAGGISQALMTTAAGLVVAIPALALSRYFQRRVSDLVVAMEQTALKLVEIVAGDREELPAARARPAAAAAQKPAAKGAPRPQIKRRVPASAEKSANPGTAPRGQA